MQPNGDFLNTKVDGNGQLALSPELASRYGVKPGDFIHIDDSPDGLHIYRPSRLSKLYIEPTNQCNLDCRTCLRNVWDEPMGKMSEPVFARIIKGLRDFSPTPKIFFGGLGEPLFHPRIVDMVTQVKALGASVELITNATLLSKSLSQELIKTGLDMLWVSIDGATPKSYADIRLGAALPQVLENLHQFQKLLYAKGGYYGSQGLSPKTQLGITFVAMKRNITDLPQVIDIGQRLGAEHFMVTNILPYTREMMNEALYYEAINQSTYGHLSLPRMDLDETTHSIIYETLHNIYGTYAGLLSENARNRCPFIANGAGAISWDGNFSPCLPLLHSHTSYLGYLHYYERFSKRWAVGNVTERSLLDIWNTPEHIAFRERVQAFDFSPCATCGSCEWVEKNEEDCFGNKFPTCGGCLWAQGVIQCP